MGTKSGNGNQLSRRKFLTGAGVFAAGAVLGASSPGLSFSGPVKVVVNGTEVVSPVPPRIVDGTTLAPVRAVTELMGARVAWEPETRTVRVTTGKVPVSPTWPWPYVKLDPGLTARLGYDGYYEGACCYGAAKAIIGQLAEKVGYPYTMIPIDMFRYGEGGIVGWSSLCGALNGASAAINLVCGKDTYNKIINELMGWYTEEPFPSSKYDSYSKFPGQVQSVSGSPLCHVSVTNWCKTSGYGAKSPERSERCAKLAGDVAARAVELLNSQAEGKFVSTYKAPATISQCMSCHGTAKMNNTRGKMNCVQCHEPHSI